MSILTAKTIIIPLGESERFIKTLNLNDCVNAVEIIRVDWDSFWFAFRETFFVYYVILYVNTRETV